MSSTPTNMDGKTMNNGGTGLVHCGRGRKYWKWFQTLTFNKSAIVKLGKPSSVKLLMNKASRMIAVQPCDDSDENATPFFKAKKSGLITVRWNNGELISTISKKRITSL